MDAGELRVDARGREAVVYPPTELDLTTAPLLDMLLSQATALGVPRIVVDLRNVEFIDARSVRLLSEAAGAADAGGRRLVVRNPCRHFLRIAWALDDPSVAQLVVHDSD